MTNLYFSNSNTADVAQEVAMASNVKILAMQNNLQVAVGDLLIWTPIRSYSSKWTSAAYVAFITPKIALMKGYFTSTVSGNDDPIGCWPRGYTGVLETITYSTIASNPAVSLLTTLNEGAYGLFATTPEAAAEEMVSVENITYHIADTQSANDYQVGFNYIIGEQCVSAAIIYVSLQNNNEGNDPAASPTFWQVVA